MARFLGDEYKIKLSSKTAEKIPFYTDLGFEAYVLNEDEQGWLNDLLECDYLFINFPPSKFDNYIKFLSAIYAHPKIKSVKKIIFISSTSVYPSQNGLYTEECKIDMPTSQIVYDAELTAMQGGGVIFRCAGLMGDDRIAGKYFAGKTVNDGGAKVNHVHMYDVLRATKFVLDNDISGVFNLCADEHPTKKELYSHNAKRFLFAAPVFETTNKNSDRIIDGTKIKRLEFQYEHVDPMLFV